jgi:hypothetical protein
MKRLHALGLNSHHCAIRHSRPAVMFGEGRHDLFGLGAMAEGWDAAA